MGNSDELLFHGYFVLTSRSIHALCVSACFLIYLQKSVVCPLGQKGTLPVRKSEGGMWKETVSEPIKH